MHASRFRRRFVLALLVAYSAFVLVVTLTPQMPGSGVVSRAVHRLLYELQMRGITGVEFLDIEFLGNIVMFVPLGIFAALLVPKRVWWILLLMGTLFSAAIELFQGAFLPSRFPEWRDIVSNSTGFLIGAAGSVAMRLIVTHRDSLVELDRRVADQNA